MFERFIAGAGITYLVVLFLGLIGWVWNIYAVLHSTAALSAALNVIRIIGIFVPPLGAFMGLFLHNG